MRKSKAANRTITIFEDESYFVATTTDGRIRIGVVGLFAVDSHANEFNAVLGRAALGKPFDDAAASALKAVGL